LKENKSPSKGAVNQSGRGDTASVAATGEITRRLAKRSRKKEKKLRNICYRSDFAINSDPVGRAIALQKISSEL
jgi:hypothetical protein